MANVQRGKLGLIHVGDEFVVTPFLEGGRYADDIQNAFRANGKKILRKAEASVRKDGLTVDSVIFEIVGGRAADIIVAQAKKWHADILVIGTHGRRGISRLVMGSDAEQIIRIAPAPVLLVRSRTSRG